MRGEQRRFFAIAVFAAVVALGLSLGTGQAAAQPMVVTCSNTNFGTVILDDSFTDGISRPLTFIIRGTCIANLVITRDDVTFTTDGAIPATITAADPSKPTILLDGARRIVIDGKVANGFTVHGGTFGIGVTRGGSVDVKNCRVTGASNTGIIASNSGTASVDACSVTGNVNGVIAANTAATYITNSTVSGNSGSGLVATRSAYLRVGQDREGNAVVKPVIVSGNSATGIVITESSSGSIVGGTVETSGSSNIFVGRGSGAEIGLGSNNLTGGVLIRNAVADGINIGGGNATIIFSTITGNHVRGIVVYNGGSAQIGVTYSNTFGPNTISGNTGDGIGVFHSGAAFIGGNTVDSNGVFGVNVGGASADLVGGNMITNNAQTGVFAGRGAQVLVGDPGFGPPGLPTIVNTISGNGSAGPTNGGIFAYAGANIYVNGATISNNVGPAVQAFEAGVIELRGATAVTVPTTASTAGAVVQFGSTLRVRETASIVSATGDGIQASNLSAVNIQGNVIQGNGTGAVGVRCFNTSPLAASAATLTGNLTNVTGTAGSKAGCNLFQ